MLTPLCQVAELIAQEEARAAELAKGGRATDWRAENQRDRRLAQAWAPFAEVAIGHSDARSAAATLQKALGSKRMQRFHHFGRWEEWYDRQTGRVYCTHSDLRGRRFVARPRWVRHSDGSANTVLLLAIKFGEVELAEWLMQRKRDVECVVEDKSGRKWSYLELYTRDPSPDSERDASGDRFDVADGEGGGGDFAFRNGSDYNRGVGVGTRFESYPDLCAVNALSRERAAPGTTALRLAAARGFAPLVVALLQDGSADPKVAFDLPDAFGRRALHDVARAPFLARWEQRRCSQHVAGEHLRMNAYVSRSLPSEINSTPWRSATPTKAIVDVFERAADKRALMSEQANERRSGHDGYADRCRNLRHAP